MSVEIAADYLKKLHYFGRKMENMANTIVWFGGFVPNVRNALAERR